MAETEATYKQYFKKILQVSFLSIAIFLASFLVWVIFQNLTRENVLEAITNTQAYIVIILAFIYIVPFVMSLSATLANSKISKKWLIIITSYLIYLGFLTIFYSFSYNPISRSNYEYEAVPDNFFEKEMNNQKGTRLQGFFDEYNIIPTYIDSTPPPLNQITFDPNAEFFEGRSYPEEIIPLYNNSEAKLNCTDNYYKDNPDDLELYDSEGNLLTWESAINTINTVAETERRFVMGYTYCEVTSSDSKYQLDILEVDYPGKETVMLDQYGNTYRASYNSPWAGCKETPLFVDSNNQLYIICSGGELGQFKEINRFQLTEDSASQDTIRTTTYYECRDTLEAGETELQTTCQFAN